MRRHPQGWLTHPPPFAHTTHRPQPCVCRCGRHPARPLRPRTRSVRGPRPHCRPRRSRMQLVVVTRVVDSMVHAPRPTRAEATDVANLVLDGADGIILGAETFRGIDPVQAARTVLAICRQAEAVYDAAAFYNRLMDEHGGFREANLSKVGSPPPPTCVSCMWRPRMSESARRAQRVVPCGTPAMQRAQVLHLSTRFYTESIEARSQSPTLPTPSGQFQGCAPTV